VAEVTEVLSEVELNALERDLADNPPPDDSEPDLQRAILSRPDDVSARLRLYALLVARLLEGRARPADLVPHLTHLIVEIPSSWYCATVGLVHEDDPMHVELRRAWDLALASHGDEPNAIAHAADFHEAWDFVRAGELLRYGRNLDPYRFEWRLACHELLGADLKVFGCTPLAALNHFEASPHGLFPGNLSHPGLASIAAFEAGLQERSLELAEAALALSELGYCDDRHQAHSVRGLILMSTGTERPKEELLASIVPRLTSQGPCLRLARCLAEAGEPDVVRQFLTGMKDAWDRAPAKSALWLKALNEHDFEALSNPGR
jgi:hypothetical protein